jgi:hypothetical protein
MSGLLTPPVPPRFPRAALLALSEHAGVRQARERCAVPG